jgi:transposase-like protein
VKTIHRQFRKVTKARTQFPNDEALIKTNFLPFRDLEKWTASLRSWPIIIFKFSINFNERLEGYV